MDYNTKVRDWQLNSLRSERRHSRDRNHYSYEGYREYGGYGRDRQDEHSYGPRHHDNAHGNEKRRERVSRSQEEPRIRLNGEYGRHKGYERPIEKDALCRARRGSSSRHGDCDNSQSRVSPWKKDTSQPIVAPKSSRDSLWEQLQRMVTIRSEQHHNSKCKDLGLEAKEECKPIGIFPPLIPDLSSMEYNGPSTDAFHTKCKVEAKTCLVIIDGESVTNMVSERLVAKLSLRVIEHPNPYDLQWLEECGIRRVKTLAFVPLRLDALECDVLCDVVPMNVCDILLGKPWEYDNMAIRNEITKEYTCSLGKTNVRLRPFLPLDDEKAYEHLRKEREREREKAQE